MAAREPRGRLFRKYVVLFGGLVSGVLLASGLIEIYFSFRENQVALVAIQREKALGAAARIEQFIREIERQVGWVSQPQIGLRLTPELRRLDYLRLLRQVQAITELVQLDATGREQLRVSRLAMDVIGSQADFSREPKFLEPKRGKPYFSEVHFQKESEPYLTLAIAGGGEAGVTVAEVNLKFIWDVVSQIKIGKAGHAQVVDSRGQLIAHPDISLVLRKTDLSALPQVKAARAGPLRPGEEEVTIAHNLSGGEILTAWAPIPVLGWSVFVELPLEEARAPLYASASRTGILVLLGVGLSVLASLVLARRMVTPIRALREGAARIGAGALDQRIEVRTGDELEALASQFNRMAGDLQESYAGLEQKVDARTRELTEALEQQTATSEILQAISSSPTDPQPVFAAIVEKGTRLCRARWCVVYRFDGTLVQPVAHHGMTPGTLELMARVFPAPPDTSQAIGRAILTGRVVHVEDVLEEGGLEASRRFALEQGFRTMLSVPMLRQGVAIGGLTMVRIERQLFSPREIDVLTTFADQAVIAIENVRLFQAVETRTRELARSVEELRALGEVGQAVSSTLDLETVLTTIVSRAVQLTGTEAGAIYEFDDAAETFSLRATQNFPQEFVEAARAMPLRRGEGATGRLAETRAPVEIPDIAGEDMYQSSLRDLLLRLGHRALLAVPILREGQLIGGLVVNQRAAGAFAPEVVQLLTTFATQSALAIQNARLFRELEDKGREVEAASRHKSEFLANMSHELRTPLNAIIGFSEVLGEQMFGELNDKQLEYVQDVLSSGRHLLSLINDILDLSKVEAGKLELDLAPFDLPSALEGALTLVRERAARRGLALELAADPRLGALVGDERKIRQVVLNLLSNAVKFTPDGGRIEVRAVPADGMVEIAVSDTGIGIAPEDQAAVFEEFRQVGTDYARKREGTGLGLALAKRFVELHGGRIWVKSALGEGSTFTFSIPVGGIRGADGKVAHGGASGRRDSEGGEP